MIIPIITIDGPTASGKGTVAQIVARKLGFHYLDSGALYRLTALYAMRNNTDLNDEKQIALYARNLPCRFQSERVWLGDDDVTDAIRAETVGINASKVAAMPQVRQALLALQKSFMQTPGLVADGRDMGTVVFPNALVKVFLTASVEIRAQRRFKQLIEKGVSANIESLRNDLIERDRRDTERKDSPLIPHKQAVVFDSSQMTIEETVGRIVALYNQNLLSKQTDESVRS